MLTISFFICLGAPFLIGGGIWWLRTLIFLVRAQETTGLIVDEKVHHGGKGSSYAPIVEFQGPAGETIRFTEQLGSGAGRGEGLEGLIQFVQIIFAVRAGRDRADVVHDLDTVKVVFDPSNPSRAHIKSFRYLHFIPLLLIGIGLCISLAGIPIFANMFSSLFEFMKNLIDKLPGWL